MDKRKSTGGKQQKKADADRNNSWADAQNEDELMKRMARELGLLQEEMRRLKMMKEPMEQPQKAKLGMSKLQVPVLTIDGKGDTTEAIASYVRGVNHWTHMGGGTDYASPADVLLNALDTNLRDDILQSHNYDAFSGTEWVTPHIDGLLIPGAKDKIQRGVKKLLAAILEIYPVKSNASTYVKQYKAITHFVPTKGATVPGTALEFNKKVQEYGRTGEPPFPDRYLVEQLLEACRFRLDEKANIRTALNAEYTFGHVVNYLKTMYSEDDGSFIQDREVPALVTTQNDHSDMQGETFEEEACVFFGSMQPRRKEDVICWRCHLKGHFAWECTADKPKGYKPDLWSTRRRTIDPERVSAKRTGNTRRGLITNPFERPTTHAMQEQDPTMLTLPPPPTTVNVSQLRSMLDMLESSQEQVEDITTTEDEEQVKQ